MKGASYRFTIDFLEVCYIAPISVVEAIGETAYYEGDGYRLRAVDSPDSRAIHIAVDIRYSSAMEWLEFGTFIISRLEESPEGSRYIWLKLDNKAFYLRDGGASILCYLYPITESLSLQFNNITRIDLAVDTTLNTFQSVRRAIREERYTPIVLGRAYRERKDIIAPLLYIHSGDRVRYRTSTLSLNSKDRDSSLCIYNKSEEAKESRKDYIAESYSLKKPFYRAEVRLRRKALRDFLDSQSLNFEDLYYRLLDNSLLFECFLFWSLRLLRFRDGRDTLSILEV